MDKEKPNTQLLFDNTIARVVFQVDNERTVQWVDCKRVPGHFNPLHRCYHLNMYYLSNIESWRIENNFPLHPKDWNESIWAEFKMRWL